ncbi:MAG: hypothetical protein IKR73_00535 [Oscillospiraceae bacterium]|nr:hypothetical protein [Oscillospiraceae bacterium]
MKKFRIRPLLAMLAVMIISIVSLPTVKAEALSYPAITDYGFVYYDTVDGVVGYTYSGSSTAKSGLNSYLKAWKSEGYSMMQEEQDGCILYSIHDDSSVICTVVFSEDADLVGISYADAHSTKEAKTSSSSSKKKKKSGGIKAPSANYTGLASSNGKKYFFKNGRICKGFIKTDAGYMYFDPMTYVMKTGWVNTNGANYYFGSNGIMLANGTYDIGGKTYVFGSDGKAKQASTKKTLSSYPSIFDFGFDDITYMYDNYSEVGGTYSSDESDMYYGYLHEWLDCGYAVYPTDVDTDGSAIWTGAHIYSDSARSKHVAQVLYIYDSSRRHTVVFVGFD